MAEKTGVIYILTNPSFPEYVNQLLVLCIKVYIKLTNAFL